MTEFEERLLAKKLAQIAESETDQLAAQAEFDVPTDAADRCRTLIRTKYAQKAKKRRSMERLGRMTASGAAAALILVLGAYTFSDSLRGRTHSAILRAFETQAAEEPVQVQEQPKPPEVLYCLYRPETGESIYFPRGFRPNLQNGRINLIILRGHTSLTML